MNEIKENIEKALTTVEKMKAELKNIEGYFYFDRGMDTEIIGINRVAKTRIRANQIIEYCEELKTIMDELERIHSERWRRKDGE